MMKLLIAVDGSSHASRAIETAGRLAQEMPGLQAVLIHVRETTAYASEVSPFNAETLEAMLRQRQDTLLQASVAQARLAGLGLVTAEPAMGLPAQEIVRAATEVHADLIVMGTRGMSSLGGLLLGSVAQRVVHLAAVPVLLAK
jgi:nucleotide-binding universal stress UspA family protein